MHVFCSLLLLVCYVIISGETKSKSLSNLFRANKLVLLGMTLGTSLISETTLQLTKTLLISTFYYILQYITSIKRNTRLFVDKPGSGSKRA